MLSDEFTAVSNTGTQDDLLRAVLRFAQRRGFERITAMVAFDCPGAPTVFRSVDNAPEAYQRIMDANPDHGRGDPVMQHCRVSHMPIVWNQDIYVANRCPERWEIQAPHGYRNGISLALHLPHGKHFLLGFDRSDALPMTGSDITRTVADIQLFAVLAQEAAFRALLPDICRSAAQDRFLLTPRELECLRWTMDGKTAWEVSRILNISELTAARHINNATHKLDCINKHQAVLKAIRLGLIG